jgi:acid phosphatase (class A)
MDEPVDDLVFSKRLRKPKGDITLFRQEAKFILLPDPPSNSSLDTARDLLAVQGATYIRKDAMEKSIKKHDRDPAFSVKTYMDIFGLQYDQQEINKVLEESAVIIKGLKNKYNRPRPEQLAPYFGVNLEMVKSRTAKTPSYPSGHSTQSRLIAEIYGAKYPEHRNNLLKASEECGGGRIMAGLHYPQDHHAGVYLAKRLFRALKATKKVEYDQHFDLTTKHRRK